MSQQLVTYSGDRRLVLSAGEAIRKPIFGNSWTHIRIGLLGSFINAVASIAGTPLLACGVCNGDSAGLGAPSTGHAVGVKLRASTLTYAAGPPAYLDIGFGGTPTKRIATTTTDGTALNNGSTGYFSALSSVRNGFFVDITKGGSNYSFGLSIPQVIGTAQSDMTDDQFAAAMEVALVTDINAIKSGYAGLTGTNTLAVSESDGILDHIFIFWERTSAQFSCNVGVKKLA